MHELTLHIRPRSLLVAAISGAALIAGLAYVRAAGAPTTTPLAIEGTLTDTAGRPATGLWNFTTTVFDVATGGTARATCEQPGTRVEAGRFTLSFAAGSPCVAVFRDVNNTWVELDATDGTQTVHTARAQVHAVPYALEADRAQNATNAANATGALDARISNLDTRATRLERSRVARAWIYDTAGMPFAFDALYNVSSVTRIDLGRYRVTFACPFGNYSASVIGQCETCTYSIADINTTSVEVRVNEPAVADGGLFFRRVTTAPGLVMLLVVGTPLTGSTCVPP